MGGNSGAASSRPAITLPATPVKQPQPSTGTSAAGQLGTGTPAQPVAGASNPITANPTAGQNQIAAENQLKIKGINGQPVKDANGKPVDGTAAKDANGKPAIENKPVEPQTKPGDVSVPGDIDPKNGVKAEDRAQAQREFADKHLDKVTNNGQGAGTFYMDKAKDGKDGTTKSREGVQRVGDGGHRSFQYDYDKDGKFTGGNMHEYAKDGKDPRSYYALTPGENGAMGYKRYDIPSGLTGDKALDWRPGESDKAASEGTWGKDDLIKHTQKVLSGDGEEGTANGFFAPKAEVAPPAAPVTQVQGTTPPPDASAGASAAPTNPPADSVTGPQTKEPTDPVPDTDSSLKKPEVGGNGSGDPVPGTGDTSLEPKDGAPASEKTRQPYEEPGTSDADKEIQSLIDRAEKAGLPKAEIPTADSLKQGGATGIKALEDQIKAFQETRKKTQAPDATAPTDQPGASPPASEKAPETPIQPIVSGQWEGFDNFPARAEDLRKKARQVGLAETDILPLKQLLEAGPLALIQLQEQISDYEKSLKNK